MNVHKSIAELIGHTPLVELANYERACGVPATLLGKVESFNPTGSVNVGGAHQASSAACIPCTRGLSERLSITRKSDRR
mgnify:CR=1 FL=1